MSRKGAWPEAGPPDTWFDDAPPASGRADHARSDRVFPETVDRAPTIAEAVRVAVEHAPGAGNEAPDRVLGPWADACPRPWLAAAVAASAWFAPDADDEAPWAAWARQEPVPPAVDRARFRAVAHAPWGVWRVADDGQWHDVLGLAPRWRPEGPVVADPIVLGGPVRAVVARVIRTPSGPVAVTPFGLPGLPDDVVARAEAVVAATRAADPRVSTEEALRRRGHALLRSLAAWAWITKEPT